MIDTGLGALDLVDLATKCLIVLALLFVTLRVLARMQTTGTRRAGRLQVLESRSLAAKASVHLVAVGDRRLVVGLTPNGMTSLAELKAEELEAADFAAELAAQEAAAAGPQAPAHPLIPQDSPLNAFVAPIDAFAGRVASLLSGGRAR
jgi:flagellar biosynthetic protein FliO